jgi:acid stress-induced BolA-like protein IbaG/YrbA
MTADQLKGRIETLHPGTLAQVTDLTGTQDHWQVTIVSQAFEGKSMIEQQRLVMAILKSEIDSNEVHALTMKTYTPAQYEKFGPKP